MNKLFEYICDKSDVFLFKKNYIIYLTLFTIYDIIILCNMLIIYIFWKGGIYYGKQSK